MGEPEGARGRQQGPNLTRRGGDGGKLSQWLNRSECEVLCFGLDRLPSSL